MRPAGRNHPTPDRYRNPPTGQPKGNVPHDTTGNGSPHCPLRRPSPLPHRLHRCPYAGLEPEGELHHHRRRGLESQGPARPYQHPARLQHRRRRAAAEMPQLAAFPPHRRGVLRAQGALAVLLGPLGHRRRGGSGRGRHLQHPHRHLPRLREYRHRLRDDHGDPWRRRRRRRRDLGAAGDRGCPRSRAHPVGKGPALRHQEGRDACPRASSRCRC